MTHPAFSYLTPAALEAALAMARRLRAASSEIGRLVGVGGAGQGGRIGAKAIAAVDWIGPHHVVFERRFGAELDSATAARARMDEEADAWADFWARATNARNQRLHDEAQAVYLKRRVAHDRLVADYQRAVASGVPPGIEPPAGPHPPVPRPPVPVPTATTDYTPTGL